MRVFSASCGRISNNWTDSELNATPPGTWNMDWLGYCVNISVGPMRAVHGGRLINWHQHHAARLVALTVIPCAGWLVIKRQRSVTRLSMLKDNYYIIFLLLLFFFFFSLQMRGFGFVRCEPVLSRSGRQWYQSLMALLLLLLSKWEWICGRGC